jgi:hypothetical protein
MRDTFIVSQVCGGVGGSPEAMLMEFRGKLERDPRI